MGSEPMSLPRLGTCSPPDTLPKLGLTFSVLCPLHPEHQALLLGLLRPCPPRKPAQSPTQRRTAPSSTKGGSTSDSPRIDMELCSQNTGAEGPFLWLNWPDDRQTQGQKVQALAFIEIRPVGSPASWEPNSPLRPASQVQVADLSWSRLQGYAQASFCPSRRTSSSFYPRVFPRLA